MTPTPEQIHALTSAAAETARKLEWIEESYAPYPVHVIEYEGRTYVTPPIIENDDGKESNGRAAD